MSISINYRGFLKGGSGRLSRPRSLECGRMKPTAPPVEAGAPWPALVSAFSLRPRSGQARALRPGGKQEEKGVCLSPSFRFSFSLRAFVYFVLLFTCNEDCEVSGLRQTVKRSRFSEIKCGRERFDSYSDQSWVFIIKENLLK